MSLDFVILGAPDPTAAHEFYTSAFSPGDVDDHGSFVDLDLHGRGHLGLNDLEELAAGACATPTSSGFRGFVLNAIFDQPSEVEAVLGAAVRAGAKVLKAAKRSMFAGFTASFEAPDGTVWKLASSNKKDTGPAADPPEPTECVAILGVREPKASKAFYEALGLVTDRDYGNRFVDFTVAPDAWRLGLMPREALAKDAGTDPSGTGFARAVLNRNVGSPEEVDALVATAAAAGGTVTVPAATADWGGYSAFLTDPDGFVWKLACASAAPAGPPH